MVLVRWLLDTHNMYTPSIVNKMLYAVHHVTNGGLLLTTSLHVRDF